MARPRALDIFKGIKTDTIRRNSQRSAKWLINKMRTAANNKVLMRTKPNIGGMYLFVYDAKTKDRLPFWDAAPLVIPMKFLKGGFAGINFHYLPQKDRLALFQILGGMTNKSQLRITYAQLKNLSNGRWKFAYKRYLFSHMRTRFLNIDKTEWRDALLLPVANFQKQSQRKVYSTFTRGKF